MRDIHDMSGRGIPDLSAPQMGTMRAAPPAPLIRALGADGTFPGLIKDGIGYPTREDLMTGDDLVHEIVGGCRQMVREELVKFAAWLTETLGVTPSEEVPDNVVGFPSRGEAEPTA